MSQNNSENNEPFCQQSKASEKTNWNVWYFILVAFLVIQIIAFALITKWYAL